MSLGPEGQRRALHGLAQDNGDILVLRHAKAPLCRWPVDVGYPCLDDRDAGNRGKGQFVVTWRITLPESLILGNVAEDAQIQDRDGGLVVEEPFPLPVHKEPGKQLLIYVNEHIR